MAYETHKFEDGQVLGAQQLNEMDEELARKKSWEELGDRPFYEEVTETTGPLNISWDGNVGDREYYALLQDAESGQEMGVCKVSDAVLTVEDLTGGTLTLETPEGTQQTLIGTDGLPATELIDVLGVEGAGIIAEEMPFVVSFPENCEVLGVQVTKGTYFMLLTGDGVVLRPSNLENSNAIITERKEVIQTIDPKYIKDMYYEKVQVERIDPSTMNKEELVQSSDGEFYKVSDRTPSVDEFMDWYVEAQGQRMTVAAYEEYVGGTINDESDSLFSFGFHVMFVVFTAGAAYGERVFPEAGIYINDANMENLKFEARDVELRKIPEKYLPDTNAAKAYELSGTSFSADAAMLREISNAWKIKGVVACVYKGSTYSVVGIGQDQVDGYATLLLAMAAPALGSNVPYYELYALKYAGYSGAPVLYPVLKQKELYLNSSTSGSTKRFKITADDSGTLSAAEVTA